MSAGAQLTVTDLRHAARHPVDYDVIGEHRSIGDLPLHIANISAHGFMTKGKIGLQPEIGRIEAHVIWIAEDRCGFQFERIIRFNDFKRMISTLQPNPMLRRPR